MLRNPYKLWLGLKQSSSIEELQEQLELYAGPLRKGDQEYLKGIFLNGLKGEIRPEMKLHQVQSFGEEELESGEKRRHKF